MRNRKEYHVCKGCVPILNEIVDDMSWKIEKEIPNMLLKKFLKESEGKLKNKMKGNQNKKVLFKK